MQLLQLLKGCIFYRLLITAFILSFTCYASNAQAIDRKEELLVTVKGTNIPLGEVFKAIRAQTGYWAMYSVEQTKLDSKEKVTVNFNKAPLADVMAYLLRGKNLTWYLAEETIMIIRKEDAAKKNIAPENSGRDTSSRVFAIIGKVTDADGAPIPGATVLVKGTEQGATADAEGNFTLPKVSSGTKLLISSLGYETREIPVRGKTILAQLNVVVNELDETVVIAYGETTKRYSTSNIGSIRAEEISKQPISNPLLALQGRVPGLFITQGSGVTASNVDVVIQGRNSMANGTSPFFVIDGVPYTPQFTDHSLMGTAISGFGGSTFNFINPNDIESVEILKDADATAIYGSRAANGAILITTKKGKAGKPKIDVNVQSGWGKITRKLDLLDTKQYLEIRKSAYQNAGQEIPTSTTPPTASNYDLTIWDQNRYTDWQKALVGGTAKFTDLQASVSGGNINTQFLVSYAYHRETTVYPGNLADTKGNVHFNLNHSSDNRKFKYTLTASYLKDNNKLNGSDLMNLAIRLAPNAPALYNADGSLNWAPFPNDPTRYSFNNPLNITRQQYNGNTDNIIANNIISYEILPGLQLKTSVGYNRLQADETNITPITYYKPDQTFKTRFANYLTKSIDSWIIEPQISYTKGMRIGTLDVLLGSTFQQNKNDVLWQTGTGYSNDAQLLNPSAASNINVTTASKTLYKYNAIFARLNYRLKDRYILNITGRRDGSSRFGDKNKFNNFYAVGAAWLFSEESFSKHSIPWLSLGKIKANYGTTGNDQIGEYRYLSLLSTYSVDVPYQQSIGIYPTNISNPLLQWEQTNKLNIGIELGLFKNKTLFSINYFRNRSSNQLIGYVLPYMTGFDRIDRNFPATVQNSGLELQLDMSAIKVKDFSWRTSANLTIPRNKLVEFPNLENSTYSQTYVIGQPVNIIKAYQYAGVNSTTGLYEFTTSKGERTSSPDYLTDRTALINTNPSFYGGFSNNIQFKGFELDFLFQFVKQTGMNYRAGNFPGFFEGSQGNQPSTILNGWKSPGDHSEIQKISLSDDIFTPFLSIGSSSFTYSDASFVRLKTVSLSYTLPSSILLKKGISNARIYIQGQNLMTITNFIGTDPETQSVGTLPPLRMITMGIQLTVQ